MSQGLGGGCAVLAGNWERVRLPRPAPAAGSRVRLPPLGTGPGRSAEGRRGWMEPDSGPTMGLCVLAAEGRGRRLLAQGPTFPCLAPSWPDAWVLGVRGGRQVPQETVARGLHF